MGQTDLEMGQNISSLPSSGTFSEIRPGSRVFVHGQSAVPYQLVEGMVRHSENRPYLRHIVSDKRSLLWSILSNFMHLQGGPWFALVAA